VLALARIGGPLRFGIFAEHRYLPPYGPDLNPIETVVAELKALLRNARRRTEEELWLTVGECLALFSATQRPD
jgi:transposase